MEVMERLAALRSLMKENRIDAFMVPTDDFHCSEYVGDYFKCRQYITGFSGSAGTAVITQDEACLWTDGRYFIQAAQELSGSGIILQRMGEEGVPTVNQYLLRKLSTGQVFGFDGRTVPARQGEALARELAVKGISTTDRLDLVGAVWKDRPALSCEKIWILDPVYAGATRAEKIARIRVMMSEKAVDGFLLSSLDDICWLLNIRGNDIAYCPVALSYLYMDSQTITLFIQEQAVPDDVREELSSDGISFAPYDSVYDFAASIGDGLKIYLDDSRLNFTLKHMLGSGVSVYRGRNLTLLPKAAKNPAESANFATAHIRDGVAVTRFIYWLKHQIGKEEITEISAAQKLEEFRMEGEHYLGQSFSPIISFGEHGAIVHYSATEKSNAMLQQKGFVLADTGGHYLEGTTDITRTIVLGELTDQEKEFYTRVLRGNLNLAAATFLYGCSGKNLDYLAREPLWEIGEDYNHGTGHGVGYLLNVHEGPNNFRWKLAPGQYDAPLEEGMVTSDEPGYYLEGAFGIRLENLMICKKAQKRPCGQFMKFETLTMVPFDLDAVLPEKMSEKERSLLNSYHRTVYEKIAPYLPEEEKNWLREATRAI